MNQLLQRIRKFDENRSSFPGEHLIVGAIGSMMLTSAVRKTGVARVVLLLAGCALLVRAASGRDGLARLTAR